MKNSNLPEPADLAAKLAKLRGASLRFRNLDVLRDEDT